MKIIVLICAIFLGYSVNAQQFETGVILDSIPIAKSKNETFALYLPTNYKPNELSPILFIFSPSGNGKNGVEVFKTAAESFNYILVCSNNSRNGPYNRNFGIAERLFNHIFANFNIAENRIYVAGFSGGSRMATSIAVLSGQIAGVIACGAGFASVPTYRPSTQDFYYVGICGDRDMNYREMLDSTTYLNRLKFQNTFFTFDGNHRWPPNEQILMAFDVLEIEAHKKGVLKTPAIEINKSYTKSYMLANSADSNSQPLLTVERYNHILSTYNTFYNLDSIQHRLRILKKSHLFLNTLNQRKKAFEKEMFLSERLISRYMREYENPEKANLKWWDKELEKLDKLSSKANPETIKMLERLQYKLFAAAYENTGSESDATQAQKKFRKTILAKMRNRLYRKRNSKKTIP